MKHLLPAVQRTALRIPWAAVGGCAAALLLTAAAPAGSTPLGTGGGGGSRRGLAGLLAVVCAGLGALLFMDFQPGLRHTAAALLIFCANTALCNTRLYRRPRFRPMAAVCAAGLTQLPYLIQRGGRQWALCHGGAGAAVWRGVAAARSAAGVGGGAGGQAPGLVFAAAGGMRRAGGVDGDGFSPAAVLTAVLLLYFGPRAGAADLRRPPVRWRG